MGIKSSRDKIIERIEKVASTSTNLEQLAYAGASLAKLNDMDIDRIIESDTYTIGIAGQVGFGIAAIEDVYLPDGWLKLDGHNDSSSANYGNVLDVSGSAMVWIPRFYFKFDGNNLSISADPKTGYVIHRAFVDGGSTKRGFFIDKYGCGNINGKFVSRQGIDPCSTHSDHNPIGNLNNSPSNNYGGLYKAVKTRGTAYSLTTVFMYKALAMLSYAHGQSASCIGSCAYIDVPPAMPKGNLNNALSDVNDTSVKFTESGYSNCALAGSGVPFNKTTHNGQNSGIADLNGNMWEVGSGFICLTSSGADDGTLQSDDFLILKESVSVSSINDDSATNGAYDASLYDQLDLTGIVDGNDGWIYLGNSDNPVFAMSTDTNSADYKKTAVGIPLGDGVDSSGTTQFGNDGIYRYLRNEMACLCGGDWGSSSIAGAFAMSLSGYRTSSDSVVGGRACVLV